MHVSVLYFRDPATTNDFKKKPSHVWGHALTLDALRRIALFRHLH